MNRYTQTSRNGFTLPELIVVTAVAIILLGSLAPALSALRGATQMQAAINTISVATTTARAYATLSVNDLDGTARDLEDLRYSGTAMLFTPAGELRLVRNDQLARNGSNNLLQTETSERRNGYTDITSRDYIQLPRDVGVVGIARNRATLLGLLLLTPPFAIRFDQNGGLIAGQRNTSPQRVVYYDGDYDGDYETTIRRTAGYDPDRWDPNSPDYTTDRWVSRARVNGNWVTVLKYALPFEEIETVVGVIIYSKQDLRRSGNDHVASGAQSNPINGAARDWIRANGTVLLFSRYSGTLIQQP